MFEKTDTNEVSTPFISVPRVRFSPVGHRSKNEKGETVYHLEFRPMQPPALFKCPKLFPAPYDPVRPV